MNVTILTTSFQRPELLNRLIDNMIPIINDLDGKLKWKIIIDEITDEYDNVLNEIPKKLKNSSLVSWTFQKNIGKFRSLNKLLQNTFDTEWLVNLDDDDLLIDYKFKRFLNKFKNVDQNTKGIIAPRLILNSKFYNFRLKKKKFLFTKYKDRKISYFDFKNIFGDFDTLIFIRTSHYKNFNYIEVENDNFTPESLRWLDLFKYEEILLTNEYLVYSQYLPGGITNLTDKNRILNSKSAVIVYKKFLDYKKFNLSILLIKSLINYYRFNFHSKNKINIFKDNYSNFIFRFIFFIIAKIIYFIDITKNKL
jgi:hypothetical protein